MKRTEQPPIDRPGMLLPSLDHIGLGLPDCVEQTKGRVPTRVENVVYRAPDPSHATRMIPARSRASLRWFLVAKLPGFDRPRVLQFESGLEYAFLCLMLVRNDVYSIWEQPPEISYLN